MRRVSPTKGLSAGGVLALLAGAGCGDGGASAVPDARAPDAAGVAVDAAPAGADAAGEADAPSPSGTLVLGGDIAPVHDPMVVATDSKFYLFATGQGVAILESADLLQWSSAGQVFADEPDWITTTGSPNHLWAPHVAYFGGQYHLYYSASSFGSNESCIGHATTPSLEAADWQDDGAPVICSSSSDDFNAIDPAAIVDASGQPWLAFGSFWGGLVMLPLELDGTRQGTALHFLATRANEAIEAPFVIRRGDFYYLFASVDFCCRGENSTYKIVVGRSSSITGPYADRVGSPLLSGGGTLVLDGDERWRGPGHNAVLRTSTGSYNVYHAYDASDGGTPTLRIAELEWTADGWPVSPGP